MYMKKIFLSASGQPHKPAIFVVVLSDHLEQSQIFPLYVPSITNFLCYLVNISFLPNKQSWARKIRFLAKN